MSTQLEHFDLSGKRAVVLSADTPAGTSIADAYEEAGARVLRRESVPFGETSAVVDDAVAELGGLDILASAPDRFLAKPVIDVTPPELAEVVTANLARQFLGSQAAIRHMLRQGDGGRIVLVTHVLGERGLPNTSIYSAAHGGVHNLIRALAQEVAPQGISINGIALGWMSWMDDRVDHGDPEAERAIRFTIAKRAGEPKEVGPMAVWLSGSGAGYVTGQIFTVDGGLTQHL